MFQQKNILYASDEQFAEILAVSMESLLRHNPDAIVYILNNGLSQESIRRLKGQAQKHHSEIKFVPLKKLEEYAGRELSCQKKISKTSYFRLFMAEILSESVEKLLYLDCDTMIMNSLDHLFNLNLEGLCGAVAEPTAPLMKKKIHLTPNDVYFNAGVLLVDLNKWRKYQITKKFILYMDKMKGLISFEDQGVINHVLHNQIDVLPMKYNVTTQYFDFGYEGLSLMKKDKVVYSKEEVADGIYNPSIIHFTNSFASERPWIEGCEHRYASEWRQIRKQTEWPDLKLRPSKKDTARKVSRMIYRVLPGQAKYKFIYFANGIVRALLCHS